MSPLKIIESHDGEQVSSELRQLLEAVYAEIARRPPDLQRLKTTIERLLIFLTSPRGRTNANCRATDLFFSLCDGWEVDWNHLPVTYGDILDDLGSVLHDTVQSPKIAENFDSTPEQLFARVRAL
jgi:hypothetical protein